MSKRRNRLFDHHESLSGLIAALECLPGLAPEPSEAFKPLAERAQAAFAEFMAGVERLHRAEGDSSGIKILLEDLERVCRRAARIGADAEGRA